MSRTAKPNAPSTAPPVKRNRYIQLTGATASVNRTLETKTRALAGWKGYTTNLTSGSSAFVIDAYPSSGASRRVSGCPSTTYRPARSITTCVAGMAVSHYIETQTDWSIKKFVRTARRYRTVKIQAGNQTLTAADPLPEDLRTVLLNIRAAGAH